jgi:hypothetical protein
MAFPFYSRNVALLRVSELRSWLIQRYGSASALAAALDVTRQTAHNLLTGRTLPSQENCEKLGLSAAFLVRETEGSNEMANLNDFLMQRDQVRQSEGLISQAELNAALVGTRGASMIRELIRATSTTAAGVGMIDSIPFEWDDGESSGSSSPLLKLQPVGAQFKHVMSAPLGGSLRGYRVVFGWVTTVSEMGKKDLSDCVWNLTLSSNAGVLAWNVNRDEIVRATSIQLAEQIVKRLIEYRDDYEKTN